MKRFLLFTSLKVCTHTIYLLIHLDTFVFSIWRKRPFTYPHLLFDKDTYATQNFIENYVIRSRLKLWDEIPSFYYFVVMLLECQYTQDIHKCTKRWSMSELITTCIIIICLNGRTSQIWTLVVRWLFCCCQQKEVVHFLFFLERSVQ